MNRDQAPQMIERVTMPDPQTTTEAFRVRRDGQGFAAAVERGGYTVLILATGAERNEQEVDEVVAALNRGFERSDAATAPTEGATDVLRHKLIADIFDLPIWERGKDRVVTPPWHVLTVAERNLIADALKQWRQR